MKESNEVKRLKKIINKSENLLEKYEDKIDVLEAREILRKNKKTYSLDEVKKSLKLK